MWLVNNWLLQLLHDESRDANVLNKHQNSSITVLADTRRTTPLLSNLRCKVSYRSYTFYGIYTYISSEHLNSHQFDIQQRTHTPATKSAAVWAGAKRLGRRNENRFFTAVFWKKPLSAACRLQSCSIRHRTPHTHTSNQKRSRLSRRQAPRS